MLSPATAQVTDLVRALAVAWKNIATYPPGHPALGTSIQAAHRRLGELRGPAGEVVLGISADALVYGDEKIDAPQVQKFAQTLFTRNVAVVRFAADTAETDLEKFLRLLAESSVEERTPLWEKLTSAGVASINLQPVDYSAVQVTDDLTLRIKKPQSLWDEILRALIAGRELTPGARELLAANPRTVDEMTSLVMRYITAAGKELPEFDADATFGIRRLGSSPDPPELIRARVAQAIALHVGNATGTKKQLAVQQVLQLLRTFPEPLRGSVMRNVLRELATDENNGALFREFTSELSSDEVLEALRSIASMGKLSTHAVRLLNSLSVMAAQQKSVDIVPSALLSELTALFGEDDIDRFNPPEHAQLLDTVEVPVARTLQPTAVLGDRVDTLAPETVNRALGATLLELLTRPGLDAAAGAALLARIETIFVAYLASSDFVTAADLVERLREVAKENPALLEATGRTMVNMASPESMRILIDHAVAAAPAEMPVIQRLIDSLGAAATRNLLEALAAENNRSRRRKLFDLVVSLGPRIVDEAIPFLSDPRWYVVRNMIVLLRTVNDRRSLPEIRRIADHRDLRVRLEAIKTLLAFDAQVPRALLEKAIMDPDPKLAETAITLVGSYGIKEAVDPLLRILTATDVFGTRRMLRLRALKVLGELGEPRALPALEKFFRKPFLPWPAKQERRAAFESLAGYPVSERERFVELGLQSRDPEVREICERLAEGS